MYAPVVAAAVAVEAANSLRLEFRDLVTDLDSEVLAPALARSLPCAARAARAARAALAARAAAAAAAAADDELSGDVGVAACNLSI
mmetsp:Transcript_5539/g.11396  ORF Transcript_5539/g.11396 Transcript_5539/m.11396 type:complete len:86 (+) Transcript_5539:798-1055(+)